MKFKPLPEPAESVDAIAEMQAAVPLVPDRESSCCARLIRRTHLGAQDDAKEWLTFLRALELIEETDGEYRRLPHGTDPERLQRAFQQRVYLAGDVLGTLAAADEPLGVEAVFGRLEDRVPRWERLRHADEAGVWRERIRRILNWMVVLGLADRADGGYVAV